MARLIEVQDGRSCPSALTIQVNDVLLFHAAGGHVLSGAEVVELLGHFFPAVLGDNGNILAPIGPPNTVLFRARRPGTARIDVVTGAAFHKPQTTSLVVTVDS